MKKYFKLIALLGIMLILYFVFLRLKPMSEIPEFEYNSINNEIFSNKNIKESDKNIIFLYFSCKCGDCKELINNIDNYKKLLEEYEIILITTEKNIDTIKAFVKVKEIEKLNIPVLIDVNNNFPSDFSLGFSINLPKVLVFDKNGQLIENVNPFTELK
ncbi:TlpA family protein disulfide reductase [Flavobacterium sp.]|jgi:thiol-disulfide isomerase/thioredoxin|uniref:TlpA family protein disulfide reductase n=2 Tax=Flavobacterium sp. TaxID=239 RepID=UPI0040484307